MSTAIDQKSYLKKYLSEQMKVKKKKKKKAIKGEGFKIIDDDIDFSKMRSLEGDELDIFDEGEDAPQIVGIIDERPEEIKKLEQFKTTSKWKVINQDDGFNSKLEIEEIKKDVKEVQKENELIFGKMYSDSEDDNKKDSDVSPPRKSTKENQSKGSYSKKEKNNSDSDFSPPRKRNHESPPRKSNRNAKNYDSDLSPPRKNEKQIVKNKQRKTSRWEKISEDEDSHRNRSPSFERQKQIKQNHKSHEKNRISRRSSSSDISPPRKSQKNNLNKDSYDVRKRNRTPDSDASALRKRKESPKRNNDNHKHHKDNMRSNHDEKGRRLPESLNKDRRNNQTNSSTDRYKNRQNSDSDVSPPRKSHSSKKGEERRSKRSSDSPPPSNKKMAKTLEEKKAGLQDAYQLRMENEAFRKREEEAFNKMTDDVSGRNAKAVSRKSKRETSEERQKQREKAEKQKELDEKYKKWNKGIKQIEEQEARIQEFIHEASKPLARHKDDKDLEDKLRQVEREGDPMLQYIREKKIERGELEPEKPKYKGNFPPNRFNIRPGYRWDGVDRSNGYEKKYFDHQSKRKAQEEEAYKWSTEDL